jgi:hypothetical protein
MKRFIFDSILVLKISAGQDVENAGSDKLALLCLIVP